MEKQQLFDTILESAVSSAKMKLPMGIHFKNASGDKFYTATVLFFDDLRRRFQTNGTFTTDDSVLPETRNASRASAFTMSVLNSLFVTDKINNGIDEFFNDQQNNSLFKDQSEEQKQELKNELKNYVEETLSVKAKTDEGKAFVQKLTDEYDTIKGDKNSAQKAKEFMETSLATVYSINDALSQNRKLDQALDITSDNLGRDNVFVQMIVDEMRDNFAALASEEEVYAQTVRDLDVSVENQSKVKPQDFVEHFGSNSLSEEEKAWANNVFDNGINDLSIDFKNIMLDGKPMFSPEKISQSSQDELKQAIIAEALSGKEVTVKDPEKSEITLLTPNIKDSAENTSKSFWQKVIDFFADLLGITTKEKKEKAKVEAMKENISDALNNFNQNNSQREKTSFYELSGINTMHKVKPAPHYENDLTKTNNDPTRGF